MENNFGSNQAGNRNQDFGNYFDGPQSYQADQYQGPYYENNVNTGQRNPRAGSGGGNNRDNGGRFNDRPNRNGQRGGRTQRNSTRGTGRGGGQGDGSGPRGGRGPRGNFDPLPNRVNWPQQLNNDRQQASLNWAPTFRGANIQIPPHFFTHTRDEQLVLGQELMDLGVLGLETAQSGGAQAPLVAPTAQPELDLEALEREANSIAGD